MPAHTEDDALTTTAASPDEQHPQDTPEPATDDVAGSGVTDLDDHALTDGLEPDEDDDGLARDDGPARGPDGKFVSRGEAPPTEGTSRASGAESTATVPNAAGALPRAEPPVPWTANLYGQEAAPIPGALYKPGHGVFVPETQLGMLTALVARGQKYETFKRERQAAAQQVEQAVAPVQAEAQAVAQTLATMLDPEWITQAALDPERAIREIALTLKEKHLGLREQFGASPRPQPPTTAGDEGLDPYDAQATVRAEVTDLLAQPDYHGLFAPQDVQALERRLSALHPFVQDEQGRWYLDRQVVREFLATAAEAPRRLAAERQASRAQHAAQQAAQRNRQVTAQTTPPKPKAAKPAPTTAEFDGAPWENPALDASERRALWLKAMGG